MVSAGDHLSFIMSKQEVQTYAKGVMVGCMILVTNINLGGLKG